MTARWTNRSLRVLTLSHLYSSTHSSNTVRLVATPESRLDPVLSAFDDSGTPLAQNDDIGGTTDRNSAIVLGTAASPVMPSPPPPHSSGRFTPR